MLNCFTMSQQKFQKNWLLLVTGVPTCRLKLSMVCHIHHVHL